jgi:hypothetical protein
MTLIEALDDIKGDLEYEHPYAKEIVAKVEAVLTAVKEPTREMWAAAGNAVIGKTTVHHDAVIGAVWGAMTTCPLSRPESK